VQNTCVKADVWQLVADETSIDPCWVFGFIRHGTGGRTQGGVDASFDYGFVETGDWQ
jgi:hypothetical protein